MADTHQEFLSESVVMGVGFGVGLKVGFCIQLVEKMGWILKFETEIASFFICGFYGNLFGEGVLVWNILVLFAKVRFFRLNMLFFLGYLQTFKVIKTDPYGDLLKGLPARQRKKNMIHQHSWTWKKGHWKGMFVFYLFYLCVTELCSKCLSLF